MTKTELLSKIQAAIDDAMKNRFYGDIQIEFRHGEPMFLRISRQEKLDEPAYRGRS